VIWLAIYTRQTQTRRDQGRGSSGVVRTVSVVVAGVGWVGYYRRKVVRRSCVCVSAAAAGLEAKGETVNTQRRRNSKRSLTQKKSDCGKRRTADLVAGTRN
jgi:hypothetical protein